MTKPIQAIAVLAGAVALSACTLSPLHETQLDSTDEVVSFWGFAQGSWHQIGIYCATYPEWVYGIEASGWWTEVDWVLSDKEPTTQAGESLYYYDRDVVLPPQCWRDAGDAMETWVRTKDMSEDYWHDVYDEDAYQCAAQKFLTGTGPYTAGADCRKTSLYHQGARLTVPH